MMRPFELHELEPVLGAQHHGANVSFTDVSTDTRRIAPGDLFVALRGERFDAHDYLDEARTQGAVAVVVEANAKADVPLPSLRVSDSRRALGLIAAFNRSLFTGALVAVTGSNGKTTVKEMVRAVLSRQGPVLATQGNLNNEIGAPLTLLQLAPEHTAAVIELGASGPGEIAWTASLAKPEVAILTNAGEAHMAGFGSRRGLIEAKGEIITATAEDGQIVLNLDDSACPRWRELAGNRKVATVSASGNADADFYAETVTETPDDLRFNARFRAGGSLPIALPLAGVHNVANALLAIAACRAVGVAPEHIAAGLAAMTPVKGRMQNRVLTPGLTVIDDSYNANPTAMRAALRTLAARAGQRLAVLGDMAELGGDEAAQHREIGQLARELGIERLYATGRHAADYAEGFGEAAQMADDHGALVDRLWGDLEDRATVLVKGSRSAQMDLVVALLHDKVNP